MTTQYNDMKIRNVLILGASFDTGNLGVSALAWSACYLINQHWPKSQVMFMHGREYKRQQVEIVGQSLGVVSYPVRFSQNLLVPNHVWKLWMGVALRWISNSKSRSSYNHNLSSICSNPSDNIRAHTLNALLNVDLICDITGGDSFSDIYGMGRFARGYFLKRICQMTGSTFIMLPQTYGPFKSRLSRWMAKRVLRKAHMIFSRDNEGIEVIEGLIGKSEKVRLCPDVAFTLEAKNPEISRHLPVVSKLGREAKNCQLSTNNSRLIGLNVSGLLYNSGYTGKNEFGLKGNYRKLMFDIIDYFISLDNTKILLAPHVVPENWETENDLQACQKLRESLPAEIRQKVIVAEPEQGQPFFDQCEIKYLIGQCDFFLGSRMHATIAAISQCIPTVGLAYSKKFTGVYETAGVDDCVADLRSLTNEEVMAIIKTTYNNKVIISKRLEKMIPEVKKQVFSIFNGM